MKFWKEGKMTIGIKEKEDIKNMREGGKVLGIILQELSHLIAPGMTGLMLDQKAEELMKKYQVLPSFKGYKGYPNVICVCINDEVVHGIPTQKKFQAGDIVTIDGGVIKGKLHLDAAITKGVGVIEESTQKFINTCEKALKKGIEKARPGIRIREISSVIQDIVEKEGYNVVRELIGHGIGYNLHEDPPVPNFRDRDPGPILQTGMTIAIEPIITMGRPEVTTLKDNWTIVTKDGSLAAQYEHTILITEKGCEILTKRPENSF